MTTGEEAYGMRNLGKLEMVELVLCRGNVEHVFPDLWWSLANREENYG